MLNGRAVSGEEGALADHELLRVDDPLKSDMMKDPALAQQTTATKAGFELLGRIFAELKKQHVRAAE